MEERLQQACIDYFRTAIPQGPGAPLLFAIPNGEARDHVTAAKLVGISAAHRAQLPEEQRLATYGLGVLPGAYDLALLLPGARTIWIECKRPEDKALKQKAGHLDPQQILFATRLSELGFHHHVIQSVDEFAELLIRYDLKPRVRWWGPEVVRPGQPPRLPG